MNAKRRGFTLIELLVAITVLAVVAVLGWRGLDGIVRARTSLNQELAETRGLQLAFAQMQSDASNIVATADIGNRPQLAAEPGRLTMVRWVFAENQPSRVQVVSYRITDGVLTRRESVATRNLSELDAAWTAALADSGALPPVLLHSDVNAMEIRTWVGGNNGGWTVPGTAAGSSSPGLSGTGAPATANGANPAAQATTPTGLQIALTLRTKPGSSMVKNFLLGAA